MSLSDDPIKEIKVAKEILKNCNLYHKSPTLIACPTCGRTRIDLIPMAKEVEEFLKELKSDHRFTVAKYSSTKKEKKSKGEVIDEWIRFEVTKLFNDEAEPVDVINVNYEQKSAFNNINETIEEEEE